jgi:proline dehydrogenase
MMRNALLWVSTNPFLAERLPQYRFVKRATKRFMPGEALGDALSEARTIEDSGATTTTTLLGENLASEAAAEGVVEHYLGALDEIKTKGLSTEISIKPTQLGLDFGARSTHARFDRLVSATDSLVWIDMESSEYVDATLDLFKAARAKHDNVGLCIQSYLHRTKGDLDDLLPLDPSIRLVKGAYNEPASVAFPRKEDVDQNFRRLTSTMLRAKANGGQGRPVIGTHDTRMIGEASRMAYELELDKDAYEIAMLYGIARDEQERLVRDGRSLRVLVSYGSAWFPWYMRRLAERPANVWFVMKQLVR